MAGNETLYLVYVEAGADPDPGAEMLRLAPELYLAGSGKTRSQLYHAIKRRCSPERLLVAPLADDPKFKGMEAGALAWLRANRSDREAQ